MKQTMKRVKLATFLILAAGMMLFTGCGASAVTENKKDGSAYA